MVDIAGTGTPSSASSTGYNWPWASAVEIATDMAAHFAGTTGFTAGNPPTLTAALVSDIEAMRDTYAQPLILSYLSKREHELLTRVHEYLTDPNLGADGTTTQYTLTLTGTSASLLVYLNYSGNWADRKRGNAESSGYTFSGNVITFTTAPTEGTTIIAEYDHTSIPSDLQRWTRILAGYHYLMAHVYVGDDPNVVPEMLQKKFDQVMAELEYIRSSGTDLSISEFKTLRFHEHLDDTQKKSRVVEFIRR